MEGILPDQKKRIDRRLRWQYSKYTCVKTHVYLLKYKG